MSKEQLFDFVKRSFIRIEHRLGLNDYKLFFFLILLFGMILRIFSLESNGLWVDEIWSMNASHSSRTIAEIIQLCINDTHPPLFDILLHCALIITGDYEFTARYLSLLIGLLGILLTYFYAHKIFERRKVALISLALVSFNYFHVIYSFEGRFYSLVYLLSLVSFGELYRFLHSRKIAHLILFTLCNVCFVYTHYYGSIMLFVLSLIVLILWFARIINLKTALIYAVSPVIVLLAFIPWLPNMFSRVGEPSWISEPRFVELLMYFYLYTGKNPVEFLILFLPVILGFYFLKKRMLFLTMALGAVWLGYIVPYVISILSTPLLHVRYTIYYLPALLLLSAYFWDKVSVIPATSKKWLAAVAVISMFTSVMILSRETKPGYKDGWKEASLILTGNGAEHIYTEHVLYLNYYLDYHGNLKAGGLEDYEESDNDNFWWLSTNYDTKNLIEQSELSVVQEHQLSNHFVLYELKR